MHLGKDDETKLRARIHELEAEVYRLRHAVPPLFAQSPAASLPEPLKPILDDVQAAVGAYFHQLMFEPEQGTIGVGEQRYVLVRAASLSKGFLDTVQKLYADRGPAEASRIGRNFLFDFSHVIGLNDARAFHQHLEFHDAFSRMTAGPVHFAYTGWAYVNILPESQLIAGDDFFVVYCHPYSFEADSWLQAGERSDKPVCIMNAGYSSGWCTESFGMPLTAVEVSCRARGDEECCFVMAPPHKIEERLKLYQAQYGDDYDPVRKYDIPSFFERKKVEEEMRRARQLAEESVKAKTDFIANISHELRTPLGALLGFTELLDNTALTSLQSEYLDVIQKAGKNLLALINDLLDISKLDAGQLTIAHEAFDLREAVQEVAALFSAKANEKGLALILELHKDVNPHVNGDPTRLKQILTNLLSNAIKFTEKGSVHLECHLETAQKPGIQRVSFVVTDTGIGIPESYIPFIFDRFSQGDTHIARKYGGTGLGLAITRQLVALQGGVIELRHTSPNGTQFRVQLDYPTSTPKEPSPKRPPEQDSTGPAGYRILVVEDNILVRKLTEIILKQAGYHAEFAENGQQALDILKHEKVDLILMDVQMPIMDGYTATRIIREDLKMDIPIIAMTAHVLADEKEVCLKQGMNDYIAKPFAAEVLKEKVRLWLKKG
jgi:signal transduction histidine kinase/CheY-like chemotaxis protein